MANSLERNDGMLGRAFAEKSDNLAREAGDAAETAKIIGNLTNRIDHIQELFGEEIPNGRKAQLGPELAKLIRNRTEMASGKPFTSAELEKIAARVESLEAQLLPSGEISSN